MSKLVSDENCTKQFSLFLFLFVCLLASGEDDSHETYILLVSFKVVVTTVQRKSMDIKMYGIFKERCCIIARECLIR